MNNKKGFTLVEITLSIVLVLMLALLVVPSLINYDGSAKEKLYESKVKIILDNFNLFLIIKYIIAIKITVKIIV